MQFLCRIWWGLLQRPQGGGGTGVRRKQMALWVVINFLGYHNIILASYYGLFFRLMPWSILRWHPTMVVFYFKIFWYLKTYFRINPNITLFTRKFCSWEIFPKEIVQKERAWLTSTKGARGDGHDQRIRACHCQRINKSLAYISLCRTAKRIRSTWLIASPAE